MKRPRPARKSGFSLPEVLVALVIFGFVMSAVLSGTLLFSRMFATVASSADVQRQERWLEGNLGRDIRMATEITQPVDDEIQVQRADATTVTYFLVSQGTGPATLMRRLNNGPSQPLVSGIKDWTVTLPSGGKPFRLVLTVETVNAKGERQDHAISSSFSPRTP